MLIRLDTVISHTNQCYFLTSASPSTPIVYSVERLRKGRSYVTRAVKAVQNGNTIFFLLCSFHKPEPWQPSHQWPMPNVPKPDDCELEELRYEREIANVNVHPKLLTVFESLVAVRLLFRMFLFPLTFVLSSAGAFQKPNRYQTCQGTRDCGRWNRSIHVLDASTQYSKI